MNNVTNTKVLNLSVITAMLESNDIEYMINVDGTISCELPITLIYVPADRLRKVDATKIPSLKQALLDQGQLHPLSVAYDEEKKQFALWEGGHRLVAMNEINPNYRAKVTIGNYNMFTSIFGNTARVAQKTSEVVKAICHLASSGYNFDTIASRLNLDLNFVNKHFKLGVLPESVRTDLDNNVINIAQAYEIATAMMLPESKKLSSDQITALLVNAKGLAVDPATNLPKSKASAAEIKSMVSRFKSLNEMERKKLLGVTSDKKVFVFTECFSMTRLEKIKLEFDKQVDDSEIDGIPLTCCQEAIKGLIDEIYMRSEEDKMQARERFLEKNPDGKLDIESL